MNGLKKVKPVIKKISFPHKGKMNMLLIDGREISVPLQYFQAIQKLKASQRDKWYVIDGEMFSFENCNEIFHIEQVLGKENIYSYKFSKNKIKP